jgi:hypothetical protein
MNDFQLEIGDSISGLLADGIEGTPWVGATIKMDRRRGLVVEVPYVRGAEGEQFDHVRHWFESQQAPTNMELLTPEGAVGLFGIMWGGFRAPMGTWKAAVGKLQPSVAVLESREGRFEDPLVIDEVYSWIDGLNGWSGLSAVSIDPLLDERNVAKELTLTVKSELALEWVQGDANMRIQSIWSEAPASDGYQRKVLIADDVSLVSSFRSGPRCFDDHYREQQKVRHFMTFMYGRQLFFRRHALRDERYSFKIHGRQDSIRPRIQLISSRTFADSVRDVPSHDKLNDLLAGFQMVGADGMEAWCAEYEKWERFILPSVNVLGRDGVFAEDVIVSTSMSMEAAGELIDECDGEECLRGRGRNLPVSLYIYRCLHVLELELSDKFGGMVALSRAIANTYNAIKHSSRGGFPDGREISVVCRLNKLIVRLLALRVAKVEFNDHVRCNVSVALDNIVARMSAWSMSIDENGKWRYEA